MNTATPISSATNSIPARPRLPMFELLETKPRVDVADAEYWRLLGYPANHEPSERARELAAWAREWYAANGRPWVYLREASLAVADERLELDGTNFSSRQLHDHLREFGAQRTLLMAVSAGRACEEHARELWQQSKPDEYFFLEVLGSAVVEHLCATLSGRVCELADRDELIAIPHFSPGYTGWDIAEQRTLFDLIVTGATRPIADELTVLSSGMLKPKKSLLAVVGLAPRTATNRAASVRVPCESCALTPCSYRRTRYRFAAEISNPPMPEETKVAITPIAPAATYSVSRRALAKWAVERVRLDRRGDGQVEATFRFDGTTCSNMGRPIAFDYQVELGTPQEGYRILRTRCAPVSGEDGYRSMCAYLTDADGLMKEIASAPPVLGQRLDEVLTWVRDAAPSGCHCTASSRAHKWGLALEAIHFALAQPSDPSRS